MKLEIIKNNETSLIIDDVGEAIDEKKILGQGYMKAIETLQLYIEQTKQIRQKLDDAPADASQINNMLYRSPQNIIAFSGKRGTGKTSTMLSFAEFLEKKPKPGSKGDEYRKEYLPGLDVIVLSPLDPTMLENDQDILSVVLSRLLYKAEERWTQNTSFYHEVQNLEGDKNELLRIGNDCMNGILAIKKKKEIKSLSDLQRVGDSAVLKKRLFDFVECVNAFCLGKDKTGKHEKYLVIPIDDTDCQIQKAHAVMEDIRRYLTLPNVVILMATDADMLRNVFAQHYAEEFKIGIDKKFLQPAEMQHYAEKYLTKLIPATHRIYLPVFENIIRENSDRLELGYYDDESRNKDLITKTTKEDRKRLKSENRKNCLDFDFQSKILSYIYQKTGIAFIEHEDYVNNIIPTTMRGLSHLLNLLYYMKKLPSYPSGNNASFQELLETEKERIRRAERNLDIFEEYFINEWVPAKVPGDMVRIVKEIEEQVPAKRIQYAFDKIINYYVSVKGMSTLFHRQEAGYYDLMRLLSELNGMLDSASGPIFNDTSDFYNTFAVRTLITIKNSKLALKHKRIMLNKIQDNGMKTPISYLDSELKNNTSFPQRSQEKTKTGADASSTDGGAKYTETEYYNKYLMPVVDTYTRFITNSPAVGESLSLADVFKFRGFCWDVFCNWDVQDAVYKAVVEFRQSTPNGTESDLWQHIYQEVAKKNCFMLKLDHMDRLPEPDQWTEEFRNILKENVKAENLAGEKKVQDGIQTGAKSRTDPKDEIRRITADLKVQVVDMKIFKAPFCKNNLKELDANLEKLLNDYEQNQPKNHEKDINELREDREKVQEYLSMLPSLIADSQKPDELDPESFDMFSNKISGWIRELETKYED